MGHSDKDLAPASIDPADVEMMEATEDRNLDNGAEYVAPFRSSSCAVPCHGALGSAEHNLDSPRRHEFHLLF